MWFYGDTKRHRRTEYLVPRLKEEGKIVVIRWGNRNLINALKHKHDTHYDHGNGVTEIIVRIWRSDMGSTIVPIRFFRGRRIIPDGAFLFGRRLMLLEFCTSDNVHQRLKSKMECYQENLAGVEEKFQASAFVVFVLDIPREQISIFLQGRENLDSFFFVDYATFKSVPIGQQLKAPIYIWGGDGKEYALSYES